MRVWLSTILSVLFSVCVATSQADERPTARQVMLQGILGNKALLLVDGQRLMLSARQGSQQGIRILRIGEDWVKVSIDGKTRRLGLGDSYSVTPQYKARSSSEVVIAKNNRGMYSTVGSINGLPVSFLVDTGASTIAMNAHQARRLGIDYLVKGEPTFVGTASGMSKAYRVTLDKVMVGGISQHNVPAVVIDSGFPVQTLLGMSFLGRLEIQRDGNVMRLRKKF